MILQPHQPVERDEADGVKQQHAESVGQPVLLLTLVDAAERVKQPLDRAQKSDAALENRGHIATERACQRNQDRDKDRDLHPAICGHIDLDF